MRELLEKPISKLQFDKKIKDILIDKEIDTLYKVCTYSRMELANEIGLNNIQINDLIIYLQLQGLDLKPNHAKKNVRLDSYMS